jgi:ABC-type antimicrobial peptide transport system permease subunit
MHLATLFAVIAVLLSALGLYGTLAYAVTQRRREIGICLALGIVPRAVVARILREGLVLAGIGIVVGAAGSFVLGRFVASQLFGVTPFDPRVMAAMAAALSGVAVVACIVPARRAAHTDVMRILSAP